MPWFTLSKLLSELPTDAVGVERLPEPPGGWTPGKWWFVAFSVCWGDKLTRLTMALIIAAALLVGTWIGTRERAGCHYLNESTLVHADRPSRVLGVVRTAWCAGVRIFRGLLCPPEMKGSLSASVAY